MQSPAQLWMFPCWENMPWSKSDGGTCSFPLFSSTILQSHFLAADWIHILLFPLSFFLLKLEPFFKIWILRILFYNLLWWIHPPRWIQSFPSPANSISSLHCHLTVCHGDTGSFTAVSNPFVWFSQLDWKVFGRRTCLLWDSMTQWLVWGRGHYYILITQIERLTRLYPSSQLSQDIAWIFEACFNSWHHRQGFRVR